MRACNPKPAILLFIGVWLAAILVTWFAPERFGVWVLLPVLLAKAWVLWQTALKGPCHAS